MSTCSLSGKRIGNVSGNMLMAMVLLLLLLHSPWAMSNASERNKSISDIYWLDCSGSMARLDSALNTVSTMTFEELLCSGVPLMDITPNGKEILVCSGGYLYRIDPDTLTLKTDRVPTPEGVSIINIFPITDDIVFIGGFAEAAPKTTSTSPVQRKGFVWNLKTNKTASDDPLEMGQQNVRMSPDHSFIHVMTDEDIRTAEWPRCTLTVTVR